MALHRLMIVCSVVLVYLCFALLASATEFSPLTGDDFGQKYEPEPWGQGIDKSAPQNLQDTDNAFYNEAKDNEQKRGTKNDRLRGLRRLSRLYGELGLDYLRPVKKTPETADDSYNNDEKRNNELAELSWPPQSIFGAHPVLNFPKRDAGPHAWYGTGMFGKRADETRGRWRIRSPRPQPFRVGLFGKRDYETVDLSDIARIIDSIREEESRR